MVFDEYAKYYDLLYRDKDYDAEAEYINQLIRRHYSSANTILDLGCGTGKHAELLTEKGYYVHGIDVSDGMLKQAFKRAERNDNLKFSLSNIQDFNLGKKFDVITALFHVMSYQESDEKVNKVLKNAYNHLHENGILVFDCWYGPAVLTEKPEVRVKRLENDEIVVTRIAEPLMRENDNIVEVNYDIFIKNKKSKNFIELRENHIMRYFFKNEIDRFLINSDFKFIECFEFMSNKEIGKCTWGVCVVCKKLKKY